MANNRNNKRHPLVRVKRTVRLYYLKLARIDDPPERIARGAAIGVLMGILPTFGLGTVFAFLFSFILKANKAAAIIGSVIMNPLTQPFFWTVSIMLGSLLLGEDSATILAKFKDEGILKGLGTASIVYLLGNALISTAFAFGTFYLVKAAIIKHREHKKAKRLARREREKEHLGDIS